MQWVLILIINRDVHSDTFKRLLNTAAIWLGGIILLILNLFKLLMHA